MLTERNLIIWWYVLNSGLTRPLPEFLWNNLNPLPPHCHSDNIVAGSCPLCKNFKSVHLWGIFITLLEPHVALTTSVLPHFLPLNIYASLTNWFWEKCIEIDWQCWQTANGRIWPQNVNESLRTGLCLVWLMHMEYGSSRASSVHAILGSLETSRQEGILFCTSEEDLRMFILLLFTGTCCIKPLIATWSSSVEFSKVFVHWRHFQHGPCL